MEGEAQPGPAAPCALAYVQQQQFEVDDLTEVPEGLFNKMVKRGREARKRGQHVLVKGRSSHLRLVRQDRLGS